MKVRDLLEIINKTKENFSDDDLKCRWIADVEGRVLCELYGVDPKEHELIIGENYELMIPDAYSRTYLLYLLAMIEFVQGNFDAYSKMRNEYENSFSMYAKYLIRNR